MRAGCGSLFHLPLLQVFMEYIPFEHVPRELKVLGPGGVVSSENAATSLFVSHSITLHAKPHSIYIVMFFVNNKLS